MAEHHPTEAACLLNQGATYVRRVGFNPVHGPGDPIFAGVKRGAFSIYFGDAPIYHFDLEGRWQRAFVAGTHYLKGLDGAVHAIERVRIGENLVLERRTLSPAEATDLDERVRSMAQSIIASVNAGLVGRAEPPAGKAVPLVTDELRVLLDRISRWDSSAWLAHRRKYDEALGPISFLPPECQNAVVVQGTCESAPGFASPLEPACNSLVRSGEQFAEHIAEVAELWGRRLLQSRVVFLGGNEVLHQPVDNILGYLSAIGRTFPIEPRTRAGSPNRGDDDHVRFDGVHTFLTDFARSLPDRSGFSALAAHGVVRVSLGVESGSPAVRSMYRKNWDNDALRAAVADLKSAGLGTSVLTIVGAGGVEQAEVHLEQTARLIESLELGAGDFVFLLDENEICDSNALPAGLTPLSRSTWLEQQGKLKEALAPLKKRAIKVLPYTLEKQWT